MFTRVSKLPGTDAHTVHAYDAGKWADFAAHGRCLGLIESSRNATLGDVGSLRLYAEEAWSHYRAHA